MHALNTLLFLFFSARKTLASPLPVTLPFPPIDPGLHSYGHYSDYSNYAGPYDDYPAAGVGHEIEKMEAMKGIAVGRE